MLNFFPSVFVCLQEYGTALKYRNTFLNVGQSQILQECYLLENLLCIAGLKICYYELDKRFCKLFETAFCRIFGEN